MDNKNIIPGTLILAAVIFILVNPASAGVEISDFFSDFTSSDVTVNSTQDFHGKAVFELFYAGSQVESQEVPLNVRAGDPVYKVIIWQKKPQHDYYTAKVSIYNDSKLLTSRSYEVSYGTSSLPGFHVVDFSPSNSGVQLLLRPFNPSVVDIKIELLDNNDVVYTKLKEDVSLKTLPEEIKTTWPFLLTGNKNYIVRLKIFTHRLYAPALVNTYMAKFTAASNVEIIADDVQVDEYGASVTVRGKSQVPFDGFIVVTARSRTTNETQVYRTQMEEILVSGKEDTAGVVWKGLAPGTYDIEILAVNQKNETIDKYETVLRIPEPPAAAATTPVNKSPGFAALLSIIILIAAARLFKGG